jgi:hypothetical protein
MRRCLIALVTAAGLFGCASAGTTSQGAGSAPSATTSSVNSPRRASGARPRHPAPYALPDRRCTPGALNPAVTQSSIARTICVPGYTRAIRPAESITEPEKRASMAAYGGQRADVWLRV